MVGGGGGGDGGHIQIKIDYHEKKNRIRYDKSSKWRSSHGKIR